MNNETGRTKPLYKQIAEQIEKRITNGEFPPGSLLPSERALARELQVNRSTIVSAYEELRASGIIESKQGSGTIVSDDIWSQARKRVPNWRHLVETGSFLPNLPLIRTIRKETQDNGLIDMATGELSSDLFPYGSFQQILSQQVFDCHLGYEHPQGNLELRHTITNHLQSLSNIHTAPSSMLITSGAQQALHLIVQCLLQPGDAVAIEDPSYCYSLPLFQSAGLRTFLLPVDDEGINPEDLVALHQKHRMKMVFVSPNFQNPTGTLLSIARKKRLLEISSEYGIPIVEDDPYSLTSFAGEHIPTLKSMDTTGNVLYVSSLTKIVASGLRIGWVIGPQSVIERLADAKQQFDFGHSIFPEWIASQFLGSDEFCKHLSRLREQLQIKLDRMVFELNDVLQDDVEFVVPEGGIHIWCRLKHPVPEAKLLKESIQRGVVFVPGSILGTKEGYVRFTFGHADLETIHEGLVRFSEAYRYLREHESGSK